MAERKRIARGLHDSTAQKITGAMLHIDSALQRLGDVPSVRALLNESARMCAQCLDEVRDLSYVLSPPLLRQCGLVAALRAYVASFMRGAGISVRLQFQAPRRLPSSIEASLLEVAEEALRNVKHHARTRAATVRLAFARTGVRLEVTDRGRGIGVARGHAFVGGQGTECMRDLVAACGGTLEIYSPRRGTVVRAFVPLRRATDREDPAR